MSRAVSPDTSVVSRDVGVGVYTNPASVAGAAARCHKPALPETRVETLSTLSTPDGEVSVTGAGDPDGSPPIVTSTTTGTGANANVALTAVADVVTLGGVLSNKRGGTYTGDRAKQNMDALEDACDGGAQ